MHLFEPLDLEPQLRLAHIFDPQQVGIHPATHQQVTDILTILGWPLGVRPNCLLAAMPAGWFSDIHKDTSDRHADLAHATVINIPVEGTHIMEWFEQTDDQPREPTSQAGWAHSIPWLDPQMARRTTTTEGMGLAYLARSDHWHRVVNPSTHARALVISIRYQPWSFDPWDQALEHTPWIQQLRIQNAAKG